VEFSEDMAYIDPVKEITAVNTITKRSDFMFLSVEIQGSNIAMMVDSGCNKSLIDVRTFHSLDLQGASTRKSNVLLQGANGEPMRDYGVVDMEITIGSRTELIPFLVTQLSGFEALLGLEIMIKFGLVVDPGSRVIYLGETILPLMDVCVPMAVTDVGTHIEPMTGKFLSVAVDSMRQGPVILEPDKDLPENLLIASAVYESVNHVKVFVVNDSDEFMIIEKGKYLGKLMPVSSCVDVYPQDECQVGAISESNITETQNKEKGDKSSQLPDHLERLIGEEWHEDEKQLIRSVLWEYEDCFVGGDYALGKTSLVKHAIHLSDERPIKDKVRQPGFNKRQRMQAVVEGLLEQGLIEPSSSPWCFRGLIVPKKDGTDRFVVDFRLLNDVTIKDSYPVPRIDLMSDFLAGSKYFCILDAAQGYHQVPMREEDKPKCAFSTGMGDLYQYKVMPYGLANAGATYQRLMHQILGDIQYNGALAYVDDCLVYGDTFAMCAQNLRKVLQKFREGNIRLKPKKCELFVRQVTYLGFKISEDGLCPEDDKVSALREFPTPESVKDTRSFVGLLNYYRMFIPNFGEICEPLVNLTRKNVTFEWGDEQQQAFVKLKTLICEAPVLAYPIQGIPFILDTDVSATAMGAVLSQVVDGVERPIKFGSHCLERSRRAYCITYRELYAAVSYMKKWHHYLEGARFVLRTDHASLKWLLTFKDSTGMLARWHATLAAFDFEVVHRAGNKHTNADVMSRRRCVREGCPNCQKVEQEVGPNEPEVARVGHTSFADFIPVFTQKQIIELQEDDEILKVVKPWVLTKERPDWKEILGEAPEVRVYWVQFSRVTLRDGVLYREAKLPSGENVNQLCLPMKLRHEVLDAMHTAPTAGHQGITRTYEVIRRRFFWPYYKQDISAWLNHCEICQKRKPRPRRIAKIYSTVVSHPNQRIAIDIAGEINPVTPRGNRYIVVIGDYFTKWAEAIPTKDHKAPTIAGIIIEHWVSRLGVPETIHSDQGREFESNLIKELCRQLGIKKTRTTPYNPASDGMVERDNRTLGNMLCKMVNELENPEWDKHLPIVMMAYRSTVHKSTGFSPCLLMLGRELRLPVDMTFPSSDEKEWAMECEWVKWQVRVMQNAFSQVRKNLRRSAERNEIYHSKGKRNEQFAIGTKVYMFYPPLSHKKLEFNYIGPLVVVDRPFEAVYVLKCPKTGKTKAVHANLLVALPPVKPDWIKETFPDDNDMLHLDIEGTNQGQYQSVEENPETDTSGTESGSDSEDTEEENLTDRNIEPQIAEEDAIDDLEIIVQQGRPRRARKAPSKMSDFIRY